jgi:hypothetical protein
MDEPILIDRRVPSTPGSDPAEGPWWIKFATFFGVPALLAVYLVWSLASGQGAVLQNIERMLYAQQEKVNEVANVAKETSNITAAATARMQQILVQICVNSAETVQERNACLNIR